MTLLCWNVAGRVRRLPEEVACAVELGADLLCLQETTVATAAVWTRSLADTSADRAYCRPCAARARSRRANTVARAGARRAPLRIEVINGHSPTSPKPNLAKVRTDEAVYEHLASGTGPRLVCDDLSTPRKEFQDGRVWTFAPDRYGKLRPDRGERWDQAELALIKGTRADRIPRRVSPPPRPGAA